MIHDFLFQPCCSTSNYMRWGAIWLVIYLLWPLMPLHAQQKPAYLLLDHRGKEVSYKKVLKQLAQADVILFGEYHNNPIGHWMQLELLKDLSDRRPSIAVGFEMFETNQQPALDKLTSRAWDTQVFEAQTQLWNNYPTDYRPVVNWCVQRDVPLVASNAPRSLARQVAREGIGSLELLPDSAKAWLPPLPIVIDSELSSYAAMREMMTGHGGTMNADHFIAAQAIKDATMAHRILRFRQPDQLFYHLNGAYHSDFHQGIAWYLQQAAPDIKVLTLTMLESESMQWESEGNEGRADYILMVPASMTKTYVSEFE